MPDPDVSWRFACPTCGGHCFGSSQNPDGSWTRHCQENEAGCRGTWHSSEDWKHVRMITSVGFTSESAYRYAKEKEIHEQNSRKILRKSPKTG